MYLRAKRGLSVVQESLKVQLKTGINALEGFVQSVKKNKENHFRCLSRQSCRPQCHASYMQQEFTAPGMAHS